VRIGSFALLATAVLAVAYARPRAVASARSVRESSDTFALPPPSMLIALSLGYRSALADVLYTSTVISYGIHHEEHRRFEFVGQYLDSIVALDPLFCQTYRYADMFLIYQPVGVPTPDDVRHARRLLEQGLEMCPNDGQQWLSAGQFMAFIGVQFLTDDAEKKEFRLAGAKILARAAEMVSDNENVQWQALAAAGIFTTEGNREASISFLERLESVTDSEELKTKVSRQLESLRDERTSERRVRHDKAFNRMWRDDLPFVSRTEVLVVGPPYDPARCAGGRHAAECPRSWADWAAAQSP
jgi:hypothetical protein